MALPGKMQGILDAAAAGVRTPPTLFLSAHRLQAIDARDVDAFVTAHPSERYILRSCVSIEDQAHESMAGHFASSPSLRPEDILAQIPQWREANQRHLQELALEGDVHLMLQPHLPAICGGVAFLPWKYYRHHALVEVTTQGAEAAVEGRGSEMALLSLHDAIPDGTDTPDLLAPSRAALVTALRLLYEQRQVPLDVEWLLTEDGSIVILQQRPVTRTVLALFPASAQQRATLHAGLREQHSGRWASTGLSESFGNISPLTASLFEHLYTELGQVIAKIGLGGGTSFFHRLPNGQVLVNTGAERRFFSFRGVLGSFRFGLAEARVKRAIEHLRPSDSGEVSYPALSQSFQLWQLANVYFLHREKGKCRVTLVYQANEYELSDLHEAPIPEPLHHFESWEITRSHLKQVFLSELRKLKLEIARSPETVFLTWQTYSQTAAEKRADLARRDMQSYLTPDNLIYTPSLDGETDALNSRQSCIAGRDAVVAPVVVVPDPEHHTGPLPSGHILVAPYFRNEWILHLRTLAGVVLEQGGRLSHSAIVARELDLPYFLDVQDACRSFAHANQVRIDPKTNLIQISEQG